MRIPFLPTAKDVLTRPETFFTQDLERVKTWSQPITYLFFLTIIGAFFLSSQPKDFLARTSAQVTEALGAQDLLPGYEPSTLGIAALFLLLVAVLLLATSFKYWVSHWYVRLWNKEASFKKTYAVLTYGGTPGWLAMPFSALTLYLLYQAATAGGPANWLLTIISGTIWLGLEGYSIYLRVYALARAQRITRKQAVLSVYVLGLLTYLVGVAIIEFVLLTIALLVLAAIGAL